MTAPLDLAPIRARAEAATPGPWDVLPPLDLAPIRARAEAATPGPWEVLPAKAPGSTGVHGPDCVIYHETLADFPDTADRQRRDAAFIASARTDIPALFAEVERLREIIGPLGPAISDEQVADEIRAAGGDPEAIGKRGAALADALIRVRTLTGEVERLRERLARAIVFYLDDRYTIEQSFDSRWSVIRDGARMAGECLTADGWERIDEAETVAPWPTLDAAWTALDTARRGEAGQGGGE